MGGGGGAGVEEEGNLGMKRLLPENELPKCMSGVTCEASVLPQFLYNYIGVLERDECLWKNIRLLHIFLSVFLFCLPILSSDLKNKNKSDDILVSAYRYIFSLSPKV